MENQEVEFELCLTTIILSPFYLESYVLGVFRSLYNAPETASAVFRLLGDLVGCGGHFNVFSVADYIWIGGPEQRMRTNTTIAAMNIDTMSGSSRIPLGVL